MSYFIENTSKNKSPELNEIVGAKSSVDGYFYRAKIVGKTDENTYETVFIDYGFEESVNITDIVPLSIQLQQVNLSYNEVTHIVIEKSQESLLLKSYCFIFNIYLMFCFGLKITF